MNLTAKLKSFISDNVTGEVNGGLIDAVNTVYGVTPSTATAAVKHILENEVARPLDDLTVTAGWGLSLLLTAYEGNATEIRRSSDDEHADIGFTGSGDFDTAAAATHIGAGDGFHSIVYPQAGETNLTQTSSSVQPTYGAEALNGLPGLVFAGGDSMSADGIAGSFDGTDTPFWALLVHQHSSTSGTQSVWSFTGTSSIAIMEFGITGGNFRYLRRDDASNLVSVDAVAADTDAHVQLMAFRGETLDAWMDGTKVIDGEAMNVGAQSFIAFDVGSRPGTSNNFAGSLSMAAFGLTIPSDATLLAASAALMSHYGIS